MFLEGNRTSTKHLRDRNRKQIGARQVHFLNMLAQLDLKLGASPQCPHTYRDICSEGDAPPTTADKNRQAICQASYRDVGLHRMIFIHLVLIRSGSWDQPWRYVPSEHFNFYKQPIFSFPSWRLSGTDLLASAKRSARSPYVLLLTNNLISNIHLHHPTKIPQGHAMPRDIQTQCVTVLWEHSPRTRISFNHHFGAECVKTFPSIWSQQDLLRSFADNAYIHDYSLVSVLPSSVLNNHVLTLCLLGKHAQSNNIGNIFFKKNKKKMFIQIPPDYTHTHTQKGPQKNAFFHSTWP